MNKTHGHEDDRNRKRENKAEHMILYPRASCRQERWAGLTWIGQANDGTLVLYQV